MMLSRRHILGLLAAFVADPERLRWTPGKKLISIPRPPSVEMAWQLPYDRFVESFFSENPLFAHLKAMNEDLFDGGVSIATELTWEGE